MGNIWCSGARASRANSVCPSLGSTPAKEWYDFKQLYITTARMVFVDKNYRNQAFKSFDLPLLHIFEESFEQPIFGSNYIGGKVKPLFNLLPGDTKFKLWFTTGGCTKFIQHFGQVSSLFIIQGALKDKKKQGTRPRIHGAGKNGKLWQYGRLCGSFGSYHDVY